MDFLEDWNDSEEIMKAVNALAGLLQDSRLYQAYRRSRIQVERQPDIAYRLRLFKQAQAALEAKRLAGETVSFDEEKAISYQYAELTRNPDAAAFLVREQALLGLYSLMTDTIDAAWDIDLFEAAGPN
jgi:cell fate (sporulation/competence/biofilm development) regulator YlbF (YheA/YmcA/DUF963 family)